MRGLALSPAIGQFHLRTSAAASAVAILLLLLLLGLPHTDSSGVSSRYRLVGGSSGRWGDGSPKEEDWTMEEVESDAVLQQSQDNGVLELVDACSSVQRFQRLTTAPDEKLRTVHIKPGTWVFATRCAKPGKSCWGITDGLGSICRPRKSWVQVEGRTSPFESWTPRWVAVDTSCACALRWTPRTPPPSILGQDRE